MTERTDIPDDWIPLSEYDATGNPDGGTFLDITGNKRVMLIRYNADTQNDVISLFDVEVPDLIHRLVDYEAGTLEETRSEDND